MAANHQERPETRLRRRAMDYLARREHGFRELLHKLTEAFPDEDPELRFEVVDRLREENLQSDRRFAEALVRSRIQRGQGPVRIRHELRQREIPEQWGDQALDAAEVDWCELCRQVMEKRFGSDPDGSARERQRIWRFLSQRGFDSEHIGRVLKT